MLAYWPSMADEKALEILKHRGSEAWNEWRKANLRDADLEEAHLSRANLSEADLRGGVPK